MSEANYSLLLNDGELSPRAVDQTSPSRRASFKKQCPVGFIEYQVELNDTIERIALKCNTIPSEILRVNKLSNRMIFPGQILFIPDPSVIRQEAVEHVKSEVRRHSSVVGSNLMQQIDMSEAARSETKSFFSWRRNASPKPGRIEKRHSIIGTTEGKENQQQLISSRHTLSEEEAKKLDEECMQRFLKLNSKLIPYNRGCIEGVLLITPTALMFDPIRKNQLNEDEDEVNNGRRDSNTNENYDSIIIPIEIISNVILYENLALKDVHSYIEKSHKDDEIVEESEIDEEIEDERVENNFEKQSNDVEFKKKEALRRHSISNIICDIFDDTLLCYLCIKVNKYRESTTCPMDRRHKNRIQSEFWFQVPDNRTDSICAFFLSWKQDTSMTTLNPSLKSGFQLVKDKKLVELTNQTSEQDINTIRNQINEVNGSVHGVDSFVKDWEIVNLKELESKLKEEKIELEMCMPTLIGESKILKEEHIKMLNCNLISRAVSYNWVLAFSTEQHGFSLNSIYRLLTDIDSPCLIVIKDTNNQVFGAMTSTNILQSAHFYGTGESFLFTFYPTFKIFKWTGENSFFIKGSQDSLGIGCGDGINGLWFDSDLYHGRSQKCKTYDNDVLTMQEDFIIAALEIWTFND